MNKYFVLLPIFIFCFGAQGGTGSGRVKDITFRTQDNILAVKMEMHISPPACVNWHHSFVKSYDGSASVKAVHAMLLTAQASGQTVFIHGTGGCLSSGVGGEEIKELNIGGWQAQ